MVVPRDEIQKPFRLCWGLERGSKGPSAKCAGVDLAQNDGDKVASFQISVQQNTRLSHHVKSKASTLLGHVQRSIHERMPWKRRSSSIYYGRADGFLLLLKGREQVTHVLELEEPHELKESNKSQDPKHFRRTQDGTSASPHDEQRLGESRARGDKEKRRTCER